MINKFVVINTTLRKKWLNLSKENKDYYTGLLIFPYLSITDGVLTKVLLAKGGIELNPIVNIFISIFGTNGIFLLKILGIAFTIIILEYIRRKGYINISQKVTKFATVMYVFVCVFLLSQAILTFVY